jgi:carbon-monoxide dehydrogenase medium subunit
VKPPAFAYSAPESLDEALAVLADAGGDAKVLAGGQSLLPILSMRLAAPALVVDVNRIPDLSYVRRDPDAVVVGALARHAEVERDAGAAEALPLLGQALRLVAHPVIRNRGTTVGSLAHADPSGEMTAVLALTGGSVTAVSRDGGQRDVAAADFFAGPLESSLRQGELAVAARFPVFAPGTRTAFVEVARRHGDYAMCGVAVAATVDDGLVVSARAAFISMAPTPLVVDLSHAVGGGPVRDADWSAARELVLDTVDPEGDIHATAEYRRHLAGVLTGRALAEATGTAPGRAA